MYKIFRKKDHFYYQKINTINKNRNIYEFNFEKLSKRFRFLQHYRSLIMYKVYIYFFFYIEFFFLFKVQKQYFEQH